jgi:carbonic anhydrase
VEVPQADRRFVELNVLAQVRALQRVPEVASAVDSRGLKIHGLVYDKSKNETVSLEVQPEQPAQ